jgi:5-methylcytosine-specific restriction enzyme subunit McrC
MKAAAPPAARTLSLTEHRERVIPSGDLPEEVGLILWEHFSEQVEVDFPSARNGHRWSLRPNGWVGHVSLAGSWALRIEPKVPIGSMFRMLEYAYGLKAFRFSDRLVGTGSIDDFFSQLARLLATGVLRRAKRGLFRTYRSRAERLSFIRGRMDLPDALRRPHEVRKRCVYQENTADVPDNQILLWTLRRILTVGALSDRARQEVQHAYRTLLGAVSLTPFQGDECRGRLYNRLNVDYEPLHALCGFFLDHTGPVHHSGGKTAVPFLINMWELYEGFVTRWLQEHLPAHVHLGYQVPGHYDGGRRIAYRIDILLSDAASGSPRMVLDAKYKNVQAPKPADVAQVVSYAVKLGASHAMLVYPGDAPAYDFQVGEVRVTGAFLPLGDPEEGARNLLQLIRDRQRLSRHDETPASEISFDLPRSPTLS